MSQPPIRALGLMSGGLDSTLAASLLQRLGIEVLGLHFSTGFCVADRHRIMGNANNRNKPYRNDALHAGGQLQIPVEIIDIKEDYLSEVVLNPKHGYGSGMNPCIDCRIFMLKRTKVMLEEGGYDFIFTGEVLGQRPMSQRRPPMQAIERETELDGLLLRPLSAKLLAPTIPEQKGWICRDDLYGISGRSRHEQMRLAEEFGLIDYPQPAGGCCFLPDENFARKLRDLLADRGNVVDPDDMMLLKVGRHFRLGDGVKIIVGRHEAENDFLERFRVGRGAVWVEEFSSPLTLIEGAPSAEQLELACKITARYCSGRAESEVPVHWHVDEHEGQLVVEPVREHGVLDEIRI
jgi:tRNA U34 2-thiouridine synthase MnmA/TrmU